MKMFLNALLSRLIDQRMFFYIKRLKNYFDKTKRF
jgi:hypothetical protein